MESHYEEDRYSTEALDVRSPARMAAREQAVSARVPDPLGKADAERQSLIFDAWRGHLDECAPV